MSALFIGVPIGLRNLGDINDVGVHAFDDFASFDAGLGERCPDGVRISGVDTLGVAGIDMSSVSGLSSIAVFIRLSSTVAFIKKIIVREAIMKLSLSSTKNKEK